MLELSKYSIYLCIEPVDMRKGINSLIEKAETLLDCYSLHNTNNIVVFISASGKTMKLVGYDDDGPFMVVRKLNRGAFQRLKAYIQDSKLDLTLDELEQYWSGEKIYKKISLALLPLLQMCRIIASNR